MSVCADDQLHLWSLRQKRPEIVHSLKFQRERQVNATLVVIVLLIVTSTPSLSSAVAVVLLFRVT